MKPAAGRALFPKHTTAASTDPTQPRHACAWRLHACTPPCIPLIPALLAHLSGQGVLTLPPPACNPPPTPAPLQAPSSRPSRRRPGTPSPTPTAWAPRVRHQPGAMSLGVLRGRAGARLGRAAAAAVQPLLERFLPTSRRALSTHVVTAAVPQTPTIRTWRTAWWRTTSARCASPSPTARGEHGRRLGAGWGRLPSHAAWRHRRGRHTVAPRVCMLAEPVPDTPRSASPRPAAQAGQRGARVRAAPRAAPRRALRARGAG